MTESDTIATLLRGRLHLLDLGPRQLRLRLTERGLGLTRQSVHGWLTGKSRPELAHLVVLWDVLEVPEGERSRWLAALPGRRRHPSSTTTASPAQV